MTLPIPGIWEIHPMLVHFPIALLLAGVALDLWAVFRPGWKTRAAAGLLVAGVLSGWVAAAAGPSARRRLSSRHQPRRA